MLSLQILNQQVLGLVDSGASHNFVGTSFVQRHGMKTVESKTLRVKLADGSVVESQRAVRIPVKFGSIVISVYFHVLPSPIDVVLGMAWLRQVNPTIHWSQGSVTIVHKGSRCIVPSIFHSRVGSTYARAAARMRDRPHYGQVPAAQPSAECKVNGDCEIVDLTQFAREAVRGEYAQMFCATVNDLEAATCFSAAETQDTSDIFLRDIENEFSDVFAEPKYPIEGRAIEHKIHLDHGSQPPSRKLYPLSYEELQELKTQVDKFLKDGRIVPSASPYGAPILFAAKKDGGLRLCIDYRGINAQTIPDSFPLPRIDEMLSRLQGARVFSKLDLRDGYHQVRVSSEDQYKTAFNCRYGSFEWRVMPFGLRNAPSTFQRLMHHVFHDLLDTCVVVYLDDILIFSSDVQSHREHVRQVFSRLSAHNLHVKASKCQLLAKQLDFLGHIVSSEGVAVDPGKVAAVDSWPVPKTRRDIQVFLGLCNYYRRFVSQFGVIAKPMTYLTRKDVAFSWGVAQQSAFDTLRARLTSAPVLQLFDPTRNMRVVCDASDVGIGAMLEQYDVSDKGWHPIEYLSKAFNPTELNYSATDREFMGLVLALQQWRHYLQGCRFTVHTDHAALKYLQTQAKLSRRQARWLELFSTFDFSIVHVAGVANRADPVSRRPDMVIQAAIGVVDDMLARLRRAQSTAVDSQFVHCHTRAVRQEQGFSIQDGLVCRSVGDRRQIVVPDCELRTELIRQHHEPPLSGHLGVYRVIGSLHTKYWWKSLQRDVRSFLRGCQTCQATKVPTRAQQGLLQPLPPPSKPWESVTMDLITSLPPTDSGFDAIVTFVDRFSKMVHFRPCKTSVSAVDLAPLFMEAVVCRYGCPSHLVSDRDPRFVSHFWQSTLRLMGTHQSLTTAYHPESDGQSERMHRTVEQIIRCYTTPLQTDWDQYLASAEFAINSTKSVSTGQSAFDIVFGRSPTFPFDRSVSAFVDCKVESSREYVGRLADVHSQVRSQLARTGNIMAKSANKRRRDHDLVVGDRAWLHTGNLKLPTKVSRKFAPRYVGPFEVVATVGPVAFRLALPPSYKIHNVFHVSVLKKHISGDASQTQAPPAPVQLDTGLEYVVEDILDVRVTRRGRGSRTEYLVKWSGYPLWDATWEPETHLDHCTEILLAFKQRRNLQ